MQFDVIIVGGGHAGCEAAAACARLKVKTLLITPEKSNIGAMGCNSSIGGIGKGTIVKEIDALDGIMAIAADASCIHYKMLNMSKGPAVWGPRAQTDRGLYAKNMQDIMLNYPNLNIRFDRILNILLQKNKIQGVVLESGQQIKAKCVIITTGTFLSAKIRIGNKSKNCGRGDEKACYQLSDTLKKLKLKIGRLKYLLHLTC